MDASKKEVGEEDYLDIHEAAEILDVGEEELWDLVHRHKIPTHNIAGAFLRFRKQDIEEVKNKWRIHRELFPKPQKHFSHQDVVKKTTFFEKLADFWYFNDFYILCSVAIALLLYFIVSSQQ